MIVPLAILAVGSIVGGYVGIPILPGGDRFADFLAPVFEPLTTRSARCSRRRFRATASSSA